MNRLESDDVFVNDQPTNTPKDNIHREKMKLFSMDINVKEDHENRIDYSQKRNENLVLLAQQNPYYIEFNRLLNSKICVNIYILIIFLSLSLFVYSLLAYFKRYSTLPILMGEIILTIIVIFDMTIRIYVTGCYLYFTKIINILDIMLLSMSIVTIILYIEMNNLAEKIEQFSFGLLIFLRNFSQLLRCFVLFKNQKEVKKNIEEIINFSSIFEEKKESSNSKKLAKKTSLEEISFVKDEINKIKKDKGNITLYDLDFKDNENDEKGK